MSSWAASSSSRALRASANSVGRASQTSQGRLVGPRQQEPLAEALVGGDGGGALEQRPSFFLPAIKPQLIGIQEEQNRVVRVAHQGVLQVLQVFRQVGDVGVVEL